MMANRGPGLILDVRSEAEYEGVNFWPSGAPESVGRPGRIPGAAFAPAAAIRTGDGRFVDPETIRHELSALGARPVDSDRHLLHHRQPRDTRSGMR